MIPRLLVLAWLVVVWMALWEDAEIGTVLGGLAVGGVLLAVFPFPLPARATMRPRPLAAVRFLLWFVWKLVEANAIVAWEVVTPSLARVREGIVAVPLAPSPDAVVTLVANLVSLTPGTLTIEVDRDPTVLYVHVLHLHDVEEARADVVRLHHRVLHALGLDRPGAGPAPPLEETP